MSPLTIGVIGPTGFGGSHLCVELINRGHTVRGLSRHPESLGQHGSYLAHSIDVANCPQNELVEALRGLDVLVSEYGPHGGEDPFQYQPFLETARKIVLAVKESKIPYFIMVGGCGSLNMPGSHYQTCSENKDFWLAYQRSIADSQAHVTYMESRFGPIEPLRKYRDARIKLLNGTADSVTRKFLEEHEKYMVENDKALTFITACRTSFMFFDGNTSFNWTFVSPPPLYRSGTRTGSYKLVFDEVPLKPAGEGADVETLEGRLHGISAADLAIAIADEAEGRSKAGKHWTAYGDISDGKVGAVKKTL